MAQNRIGKRALLNWKLLVLLCPALALAQDPPALPAPPGTVAPFSDSTPNGWRNPYCESVLKRLQSDLAKLLDESTAVKLANHPVPRPSSAALYLNEARDAALGRMKVHFYNAKSLEVLDSKIDIKASYVALDKANAIPDSKQIKGATDSFAADIEASISSAETYPARWKTLKDIEAQARKRLELVENELKEVQDRTERKKTWISSLKAEVAKLEKSNKKGAQSDQLIELELPTFNDRGELNKETAHVRFESVNAAKKAIADVQKSLQNSLKLNIPYWVNLPAVRNGTVFKVPESFKYKTAADLEVAIKELQKQLKSLNGGITTEGSFLNTAAGQVVNLRELETIREVFRIQRQSLQTSGKDVPQYLNDQIKRIDAIIDAMDKPKEGFAPPQVAYDKVKNSQLVKQFGVFRKSLQNDINKPIKARKQWDDMAEGTLDVTSNGSADQLPANLDLTATDPINPDPGKVIDPSTVVAPGSTGSNGLIDSGTPPGGIGNNFPSNNLPGNNSFPANNGFPGNSNFPSGVGTAGGIGQGTNWGGTQGSGAWSKFTYSINPFTNHYDQVLSVINSIDPTVLETYGGTKAGMALNLWRSSKFVGYAGVVTGMGSLVSKSTPMDWIRALLELRNTTDEKQMDLCAEQGAKAVGDVFVVNTDPNQNSNSDQQFQDCSIAFIKTKFVKDYLAELEKNDGSVTSDKKYDLVEIDPRKVSYKKSNGSFFRNKTTGELYIRPELASLGVVNQPGVSFDPVLKAMKLNPALIPIAGADNQQHLIEKDATTGKILFHVDLLASSDSGIFFLNNKHEIVLADKINAYVNKLLQKRRKVMGYRNNQSNVESVLRQFLSTANPCSDPNYTIWMTSTNKDEYQKGFLSCVHFLYPRFMRLGDTEELVKKLINADTKDQNDLLKPLVSMDATFGNYVCTLISQRFLYADPSNTANGGFGYAPFNCQNLSTLASGGGWGNGMPGYGGGMWNGGGTPPWFGGGPVGPVTGPGPGVGAGTGTAGTPNTGPATSPPRQNGPAPLPPQQGPLSGAPNPPPFFFTGPAELPDSTSATGNVQQKNNRSKAPDPMSGVRMINDQILTDPSLAKDPKVRKALTSDPASLLFDSRK